MSYLKLLCTAFDKEVMEDLGVMSKIPASENGGGLGLPMMQTILSSMELWGMVLSGGKTNADAFDYFWKEFFIKDNPEYNKKNLNTIFRVSIRNGTAHHCVSKVGIVLGKHNRENLTNLNGDLYIDVYTFYTDFLETYNNIKEILDKNEEEKHKTGLKKFMDNLKGAEGKIKNLVKSLPDYNNRTETITETCDYGDSTDVTGSVMKLD